MKWRNSLSVGYKPFDDDLKELFLNIDKTLQKLMAARSHLASDAEGLMNELSGLFAESFAKQEELMQNLKFSGYYQHKYQHDSFLKDIEAMKDVLMADNFSAGANVSHISTQVSQWIVLHIATMDNEFGSYYLNIYHLPRVVYEKEEEIKANGSNVYTGKGNLSKFLSAQGMGGDDNSDNSAPKQKPSRLEMVMAMRNAAEGTAEKSPSPEPAKRPSKLEMMAAAKGLIKPEAAPASPDTAPAVKEIPTGITDIAAPVYTDSENVETIGNIDLGTAYTADPFAGDSDLNDILNIVDGGNSFTGFPAENTFSDNIPTNDFPTDDFFADNSANSDMFTEADDPFAAFSEKTTPKDSPSDIFDADDDLKDILNLIDEIDKQQ